MGVLYSAAMSVHQGLLNILYKVMTPVACMLTGLTELLSCQAGRKSKFYVGQDRHNRTRRPKNKQNLSQTVTTLEEVMNAHPLR
jgi:hypothetical protein